MMRILMIVVLLVIVDFFTGYVKAYLKCQLNSSVGLDGLIRKAMILFSMLVFKLLDEMLGFNLLNLLPSEGMLFFCEMGVENVGLMEILGGGVVLQEGTSILENLHELGVPIPTVLARRIERIKVVFLDERGDKYESTDG